MSLSNGSVLTYPWEKRDVPRQGEAKQVVPGVYWMRFPLPLALDHINLWLVEDGDGWTIVDTGFDTPENRRLWEKLFTTIMGGKPVTRIICTHLHRDHVGLAGWIADRFGAELWMTRSEYLMCRSVIVEAYLPPPKYIDAFYHSAGYDEHQIIEHRPRYGEFGRKVSPLPERFKRLKDGDSFCIGKSLWCVVVGSGHSPEHACLYSPQLKLLISGDQVLPGISSNVSVLPMEPLGNPLGEWLASCERLRNLLPDDVLVLPAHGKPFYGLHQRLKQLVEKHRRDLCHLYNSLKDNRRAIDCIPLLYSKRLNTEHYGYATGEVVAHLNYLVESNRIERHRDENGVDWYQRAPKIPD